MTGETDLVPRARFWSLPPVAFFVALAGAPSVMALVGLATAPLFGVGLIVLFSIPFGAPSYLLVGAPLFWLQVLSGGRGVVRFVIAGFLANLIAAPVTILALPPFGAPLDEAMQAAVFIHGFGAVFSPLYGLLFGVLFTWLVDPDALPPERRPVPTLDALLDDKETFHA